MFGMAEAWRRVAPPKNGGAKLQAQPLPRRRDDDHDADFRSSRRVVYVSNGGHDGHGPGIPITVLIGAIISVVGTFVTLVTFGQGQIDKAMLPLVNDIKRLEANVADLRDDKVSESTHLERLAGLRETDARLAQAIDRLADASDAQAAQTSAVLELINEMRRTYRAPALGRDIP